MIPIVDFIINADKYIDLIIQSYGLLIYLFVFLIIFLETGVVVTPFLPGDSLLFVLGAFASRGELSLFVLFSILFVAALLGNITNYLAGRYLGQKLFSRFIRKEHINKTRSFYAKYGDKTIVLARFIPIIRTFAPFIAGIGKMSYSRFIIFSLIGSLLWVSLFILAGFFFGNLPFIEQNLSLVILVIVILSLIPAIVEYFRNKSN
jgi:membrane-associated protein